MTTPSLSTHVLDTARGCPAAGIFVRVEVAAGPTFRLVGSGTTDADGRIKALLHGGETLALGEYRLTFDTGAYFAAHGVSGFYPRVHVAFTVTDERHHHVPLLLSPYGYSTYRGT